MTLPGAVTYVRTIFADRNGRRRALADELLGIPKKARLSTGAFLWIAYHAAELPCRKTAAGFLRECGTSIPHLFKSAGHEPDRISCPEAFLEVDGMRVHLQESAHRERALPRGIYEQARRTRSFELKMACLCAGKRKLKNGRAERVNLDVACAGAPADEFWDAVWKMAAADYEDVEKVNLGADGGSWCGPEALEEKLGDGCGVSHHLDMFHVMRAICRAFPEGAARGKAEQLAFRGHAVALAKGCRKIAEGVTDSRRHPKPLELARYLENNADSMHAKHPSMGTMEGTNGHVGAARLKGQGRSWSKRGAEAMRLIRCAIVVGRPLVAPPKDAFYTEREKKAETKRLSRFTANNVPEAAGSGWEPPRRSHPLPKLASISLAARSQPPPTRSCLERAHARSAPFCQVGLRPPWKPPLPHATIIGSVQTGSPSVRSSVPAGHSYMPHPGKLNSHLHGRVD